MDPLQRLSGLTSLPFFCFLSLLLNRQNDLRFLSSLHLLKDKVLFFFSFSISLLLNDDVASFRFLAAKKRPDLCVCFRLLATSIQSVAVSDSLSRRDKTFSETCLFASNRFIPQLRGERSHGKEVWRKGNASRCLKRIGEERDEAS